MHATKRWQRQEDDHRFEKKEKKHVFSPVEVDEKELAVVNSVKILGITMSNDLKWKVHTNETINPRTYTQIHTPTVVQEGIDGTPP